MSTAVVAVHLQNDVLHPDGRMLAGVPPDEERRRKLVDTTRRLLDGARAAGIPVVSVRIAFPPGYEDVVRNSPMFVAAAASAALEEGSWGADFFEELGPAAGEPVVTHSRINGFHDSDLDQILRALGADRLVICGIATQSAVEHTARHAADLGYEVIVAADACGSGDPALHDASLLVLSSHVTRIATVDEVLRDVEPAVA
jgi:nicotinamidase-related amidase